MRERLLAQIRARLESFGVDHDPAVVLDREAVVENATAHPPAMASATDVSAGPAVAGNAAPPTGRGTGTRHAVILAALDVEYLAVREHLDPPFTEITEHGTLYETATFVGRTGTWDVALAQVGEGEAAAASQVERALRLFEPEVVFFVGIAGGRKDVGLGDVVAANTIYDYEIGKDTEREYLARIKTHHPAFGLVQRAQKVAREARWQARIRRRSLVAVAGGLSRCWTGWPGWLAPLSWLAFSAERVHR